MKMRAPKFDVILLIVVIILMVGLLQGCSTSSNAPSCYEYPAVYVNGGLNCRGNFKTVYGTWTIDELREACCP